MEVRVSLLNDRLEEEVDDFIATLFVEFGYHVHKLCINYYDDQKDVEVSHTFHVPNEKGYLVVRSDDIATK